MAQTSMTNRARASALCAGLVAGALAAAAPAAAVTPVPGTLPPATQMTVNNGPGHQRDPHVSGDLVSYTSAAAPGGAGEIRYFDFASGNDAAISGLGSDSLSDVRGSTIVFTRNLPGSQRAIYAFDVATGDPPVELDPQAGRVRVSAAIGDATAAWIERAHSLSGELFAYDRTTASTRQLTSDGVTDQSPTVSPGGDVIAWERCSGTACDIYQAVKSAGSWTVSPTTSTPDGESSPDTNGTLVVYGSNRASSRSGDDIYWTAVAGGAETQLELDGTQQNPSISGDLVVFESRAVDATSTDLFGYDLSTNTLYQLTNTSGLSERISDVSVSPGGQVRVVWQVTELDANGDPNINVDGLSFQLPSSTTLEARFLQPLDQSTDPSNPVINTGKNGRVIPVKVQLSQNGIALTDHTAPGPVTIGVRHMSSCTSGSTAPVESYADAGESSGGTNEFGYDAATPGWVYNLDTKALGLQTGECYRIDVAVDGTKVTNAFAVFKPTR